MKLLDRFRDRRWKREREARQVDDMRRPGEPEEPVPGETYLSQTRD